MNQERPITAQAGRTAGFPVFWVGEEPMTLIQIPDEQAEALRARAAEQGLSLEDWLRKLAGVEGKKPQRRSKYQLADLVAQCDTTAPLTAEDQEWLATPPVGRELL